MCVLCVHVCVASVRVLCVVGVHVCVLCVHVWCLCVCPYEGIQISLLTNLTKLLRILHLVKFPNSTSEHFTY